jgi:hypothetical protein
MPLQQEGDKKAGGTVTKKRIVSNVGVFIGVEVPAEDSGREEMSSDGPWRLHVTLGLWSWKS